MTTIPERADMGDGPGGEQGTSETPPKPLRRREGQQAAFNGLEGYYRYHVKRKSEGASETPDFPVTVSNLMTCERKYAFEPCCKLFASLIAMYYLFPPPFCFLPWSGDAQKTPLF